MAKTKSFNVQKKELGCNNYQNTINTLRSAKIRIIGNSNSHSYGPVGTILTLDCPHLNLSGGSGDNYTQLSSGIIGGNTLRFVDFTLLTELSEKELLEINKNIEKQISELKNEQEENLLKIKFMKEIGSDSYNEKEFKAYRTLELVDNPDLNRIEKAKLIAKLID